MANNNTNEDFEATNITECHKVRNTRDFQWPVYNTKQYQHSFFIQDRLVGLVVRHPPRERKILALNPVCTGIFSGSSHTSDSKIGTPVATLPGTWRYRVSAGIGRPSVSILWLGEVESSICNFYLSVAAHKLSEQIHPWDTLACCWDVKQSTNKQIFVQTVVDWNHLEENIVKAGSASEFTSALSRSTPPAPLAYW